VQEILSSGVKVSDVTSDLISLTVVCHVADLQVIYCVIYQRY